MHCYIHIHSDMIREKSGSLCMVRSLAEYSKQKLPLLVRFKGRGDHDVGPRVESEETKHRASVSECDDCYLLLNHMNTIAAILLNL